MPPDHPQSNARLLREHLLHGAAAEAQFIPLIEYPDQPERDVERLIRDLPPLDVVVLGMDEDGHTASLFPGAAGAAETLSADCPHAAILLHPTQTAEPRLSLSLSLSLTWPVLSAATALFLLIQGESKLQVALKEAIRHCQSAGLWAWINCRFIGQLNKIYPQRTFFKDR